MLNDLIDYYYYFLHERHYFECHEVMEEAWKSKELYHKNDIEVGLILLATSQYHLRRNNIKGGMTCLTKACRIFEQYDLTTIGLNHDILPLIKEQMNVSSYTPLDLPLTSEMENSIRQRYPDFTVNDEADPLWIDYHQTRDRSAVIGARNLSMRDKHPVDNSPDKSHND